MQTGNMVGQRLKEYSTRASHNSNQAGDVASIRYVSKPIGHKDTPESCHLDFMASCFSSTTLKGTNLHNTTAAAAAMCPEPEGSSLTQWQRSRSKAGLLSDRLTPE